jgi:hypothetical protein
MTAQLAALAQADDGYTVGVRPEVVVEVAFNEIQRSPTYPSGLVLRFARIARLRPDKRPADATTLDELRARFERQFATKGRREPGGVAEPGGAVTAPGGAVGEPGGGALSDAGARSVTEPGAAGPAPP